MMKKRMLWSTALGSALMVFLSLSAVAQAPSRMHPGSVRAATGVASGTEEPCISNHCLFYAGDFDANGPNPSGQWNGYNPLFGGVDGTVYVPFTVPKGYSGARGKTDWSVQGLFVNELLQDDFGLGIEVTSADWSIVQGIAQNGFPVGGKMITICSGTAVPTVTPTGRSGFGASEYTILVTGIACPTLEAGTYWMTLVPTTPDEAYLNNVEDNTPAHAAGPGEEPADDSFYYSEFFSFLSFQPVAPLICNCDKFSAGMIGMATR